MATLLTRRTHCENHHDDRRRTIVQLEVSPCGLCGLMHVRHGVGRFGQVVEMFQQLGGVHLQRNGN